jgi:hypothetical protein
MKRLTNLILAGSLLAVQLFLAVPLANAHDNEAAHDHEPSKNAAQTEERQSQDRTKTGAYEFVTPKGGSLSLLTRRALQLYDQNREDIELTPAAAMYAETNIVQAMGSRLLEIGERVRIERPLLDRFTDRSQSLSRQTLAAWSNYASQADFSISNISAVQSTEIRAETGGDGDDNKKGQTDENGDEPTAQTGSNQKSGQQNGGDEIDRPRISAAWWLTGIGALAVLYYLLGNRKKS